MISHLCIPTGRIIDAMDDSPSVLACIINRQVVELADLRARLIASETDRRLLRSRVEFFEEWMGSRARASEGL